MPILSTFAGRTGALAAVVASAIAMAGAASAVAAPTVPAQPGAVKSVARDPLVAAVRLNRMGDAPPPINAAGASFMAAQYSASHKVSDETAQRVIEEQLLGTGLEQVLKDRLGDGLVGVRYDGDNARWEVALAPTGDRSVVDKLIAARGLGQGTVVDRASWTGAEQADTVNRLRKKYAAMIGDHLVSIDDAGTELEIRASSKLASSDLDDLRTTAAELDVTTRVVAGPPSTGAATPVSDCGSIWCNAPVRAGERWIQQSTGSYCTTAFPVASSADTYHGWVLTAGHCLYGHYGGEAAKCSLSWCGHFGTEYSGYYGGGDAGLIRLDDPAQWPTWGAWWLPYAGSGGADSLPTRPQYLPAVGEYICHIGTGYAGSPPGSPDEIASCGNVINNNNPITNAAVPGVLPAVSLYNMITVRGGCIQPGNSGGPMLNPATGQAVGIISSGTANADGTRRCDSTVTWNGEYVGNSLLNLGVSLKTS